MGCTKTISSFLTGSIIPSGATSYFTYNGYATSFDGDEDNLAQFVDIPADPPDEFPIIGATTADLTFDPEGHTAGYYSWTFTIETIGACAEQTVNFVIPIIEAFDAGTNTTVEYSLAETTPQNLYTAWGVNAPADAAISGIGWNNKAIVNTYSGYSNGGTSTDITDDTFTPSDAGIGIYYFIYAGSPNAPSGYRHDCRECYQYSTLTVRVVV